MNSFTTIGKFHFNCVRNLASSMQTIVYDWNLSKIVMRRRWFSFTLSIREHNKHRHLQNKTIHQYQ